MLFICVRLDCDHNFTMQVLENIRNVKCPKSASMSNNEEDLMWHGSNNCFSHVDSIGGTSSNLSLKEPEAPNLGRKSRATGGPATDAQSIYARVSTL